MVLLTPIDHYNCLLSPVSCLLSPVFMLHFVVRNVGYRQDACATKFVGLGLAIG